MNKSIFIFSILLFPICNNVYCTTQPIYVFYADFQNVCSFPVKIAVRNYSNFGEDPEKIDYVLNPGDKTKVLSIIANFRKIDAGVPSSYSFEISTKENKIHIDNVRFIELLTSIKKEQKSSRHALFWTINDPSLCP
jgi:hypothetical protein